MVRLSEGIELLSRANGWWMAQLVIFEGSLVWVVQGNQEDASHFGASDFETNWGRPWLLPSLFAGREAPPLCCGAPRRAA